jgi:hypothetical protein
MDLDDLLRCKDLRHHLLSLILTHSERLMPVDSEADSTSGRKLPRWDLFIFDFNGLTSNSYPYLFHCDYFA